MLKATTVKTTSELQQIIQLQQNNIAANITPTELQEQGFVTVVHTIEVLQQMHALQPGVIVKAGDIVVGYALVMPLAFRGFVPELEPMFEKLQTLHYHNQPLGNYRFYIMGQICIAKQHRGKSVFDMLYQHHKILFEKDFDFVLTEIATRNHRSLRAHARIGFKQINTYTDATDEWSVVVWDWK